MTDSREYYYVESPVPAMVKTGTEYLTVAAVGCGVCTARAHIHESVEFLYLTDGRFDIFSDDERYTAEAGDLVIFRSNTIHRVYSAAEGKNAYVVFKIKPSVLLELGDPERSASYVMRFVLKGVGARGLWKADELRASPISACIDALLSEIAEPRFAHDVAIKTGMVSLLVAILREDERDTDMSERAAFNTSAYQIYKAMNYINKNYSKNITVAECAASANMSYNYFSRTFKEVTGKSFKSYLCETRINRAEQEMLLTDKSITEIAHSCGWCDVSYFIARYREVRGRTPHKFRSNQ